MEGPPDSPLPSVPTALCAPALRSYYEQGKRLMPVYAGFIGFDCLHGGRLVEGQLGIADDWREADGDGREIGWSWRGLHALFAPYRTSNIRFSHLTEPMTFTFRSLPSS